ncbi:MAG: HAD family hydrolase [Chloroflexota bacterium]
MTNQISAIIFDLGNVLLGWDVRRLYNRLLPDPTTVDRFLEEIRFAEWNAKQDAGRSFQEGVTELSNEFPHYAELIQAYDTYWEESLTGEYHETVEIVRSLKQEDWKLYLLSNFSTEKYELIKHDHEFLDLFDDQIISGEHKTVKPDRAIFDITLKRINRDPWECLFIDDSLANIETANNMGFQTIHFQSPPLLRESLKKLSIKGIY